MMVRSHIIAAAVLALAGTATLAVSEGTSVNRKPYAEMKEVQPRSGLPPCSDRLELVRRIDIEPSRPVSDLLETALGAERYLGVGENVEAVAGPARESAFLRVHYPKGSYNFSSAGQKTPLGGASFYAPFSQARTTCLHYKLRFPQGFEFVKGGKLPGLYGGDAPSGGQKVSGRDGWSIRLMWRKDGQGELYEYIYNKKGKYGLSVGRGAFSFPPGRWISVDLEVVRNDAGQRNGKARLWIDGRPVIEQDDIVFATNGDRRVEAGLMFSTFFGGGSKSWASPKDQHIDFADFRLYEGRGDR